MSVEGLLEENSQGLPNRLDQEPVDDMLEGGPETQDEELREYAGFAERVLGVPAGRYVDEMGWENHSDDAIATARHSEERVDIDNRITRENETELVFDPEFRDLGEPYPGIEVSQEQATGVIHEFLHAADYNDDRARLMRELGFTPDQAYEIANYGRIGEEENEAVTELTARILNPLRDKVIYPVEEQTEALQAYEQEVRELVNRLDNIGELPEPERVHAMKNDEEFSEQLSVDYVDVGQDHYIETGSYEDEEGQEESYALVIGDNEDTETFKDYMNESMYDEIVDGSIEDYFVESNDADDRTDGDHNMDHLDPLSHYENEEKTEYSWGQGPTAELYKPEVVIGGEPGNQPAVERPSTEGGVEHINGSDYNQAGA